MSETTTTPITDEELQKHLQIQVVDVSHGVASNAIDHAEEFIQEQTTERGVKGFVKRIWHGNIARDYIRQRETQKGRQEILETGNLYALTDGSDAEHNTAMQAVVDRFAADFIHQGEENQSLAEVAHGRALQGRLQELISDYAGGALDQDALQEEKTRVLNEFGQASQEGDRNKGLLFADNIIEVAINARMAVEHGVALERIDSLIGAKVGEARMGVRTEAKMLATDRVLDKLYKTRVGSTINETTLATVTAVVITAGKFTTSKAASVAGAVLGMGVGVGVVAGLRERFRVGQERESHIRQRAEGFESSETESKKLKLLEATRYETVHATELTNVLRAAREALGNEDASGWQTSIAAIRHAHARIKISDEQAIDLIRFSSKTAVEDERLEIDISLAEARLALNQALSSASEEQLADAGVESRDLAEVVDNHTDNVAELLRDVSDKDRIFTKLQRNRTLKMAACGFVGSVAIGTALQEIKGAFSDELQNVFESEHPDQKRRSLLAGLLRDQTNISGDSLPAVEHSVLSENAHAKLPEGYSLEPGTDDTWQLKDAAGKPVLENINLDDSGHFDQASQAALEAKGYQISAVTEEFDTNKVITETIERTPKEYLAEHSDQFTKVRRELWYDSNTPGAFDHNELKLHWGGDAGIDADGNYVLNVKQMVPEGSFHDGARADAQQLISEGKIAIALSMTKDTQSSVFMVTINANGDAIIDKNNFMGQSLFETKDGRAKYIGGYAEAAQIMGVEADGRTATRMLATVVGENKPNSGSDTISRVLADHQSRTVTSIEAPALQETPIEIPFVMPFYGRRGLEAYAKDREGNGYGYGYGYGNLAREYWTTWDVERSPRLRANPSADLNPGQELSWYEKDQRKRRGQEYIDELDKYIAENADTLGQISDDTKAFVCIPVAAANESETIYKTLSQLNEQDPEARAATVVVLNLNWKEALMSDPEERAKIEKTFAEVERARADFPDLKIASFKREWSTALIKAKKDKLYGEVIKVLYDTAALAMHRAVEQGKRSGDADALLITNDADNEGRSRHYLEQYFKAFERNPDADIFSGTIRRGTASYVDYPGYGAVSDFYAILNMVNQRQQKTGNGGFTTEGPNAAVTMSIYAAIGGVEDRIGAGADAVLSQRVASARDGWSPSGPTKKWTSLLRRKSEPVKKERKVAAYVPGAQIDTLPDRLLGAYQKGLWIAKGWDKFDADTYEDRSVSLAEGKLEPEDVENDFDSIVRRIELNIEGFASNWYRNPTVVSAALGLWLGTNRPERKLYESEWQWDKKGDGAFTFKLTDEGKQVLKNRLMRDSAGRYDPFGTRVRRQIYGEAKPGGAKQPKLAESKLVT